jgi:ABC-type Fe3+ transport system permease subunit
VLTAFIIQTSAGNFQPDPAEVPNKISVAIYRETNVFQKWLLNTSLTISMLVATLAMAAILWFVRYNREVTTSGPPHARANEILAWSLLEKCSDAMLMSLCAAIILERFIQ